MKPSSALILDMIDQDTERPKRPQNSKSPTGLMDYIQGLQQGFAGGKKGIGVKTPKHWGGGCRRIKSSRSSSATQQVENSLGNMKSHLKKKESELWEEIFLFYFPGHLQSPFIKPFKKASLNTHTKNNSLYIPEWP